MAVRRVFVLSSRLCRCYRRARAPQQGPESSHTSWLWPWDQTRLLPRGAGQHTPRYRKAEKCPHADRFHQRQRRVCLFVLNVRAPPPPLPPPAPHHHHPVSPRAQMASTTGMKSGCSQRLGAGGFSISITFNLTLEHIEALKSL